MLKRIYENIVDITHSTSFVVGFEKESVLDEIKQFERCIYMFDGGDDEAVRQARDKWKSLSDEDYSLTYYQQNHAGKWEKKG